MKLPATVEEWAMVLTLLPIFICSIVGSAMTAAKWVQLHRSRRAGARMFSEVSGLISAHDYARVLPVTRGNRSHVARLIERTVTAADLPPDRLNKHIEQAGRELARELDHGVDAVGLLTTLSPLLGLFGTVVGIVLIFHQLEASKGLVSPHRIGRRHRDGALHHRCGSDCRHVRIDFASLPARSRRQRHCPTGSGRSGARGAD